MSQMGINQNQRQNLEPSQIVEPIKLVVFIVNRGDARVIDDICTKEGIYGHLLMRGRGTVDNKTAALLGLDERERDIVLVTVAASRRDEIMGKISEKLRLDRPGRGIAMSIPFSSIASQFNSYSALAGLGLASAAEGNEETYKTDNAHLDKGADL